MVQPNSVPGLGAKKYTSTIWLKFFSEIFVLMVSAVEVLHYHKQQNDYT